MSRYEELLGRFNKSLTLLDESGLNMEIVRNAQRALKRFKDLKAEAEEALPRLRKALSQAEKECEDWLEKVTSSSPEMIQVYEAMESREKNDHHDARPKIMRKMTDLRNKIASHFKDMQETASVLAAQKLVRQFEKFEENVQLPLEFGQLQKEYTEASEKEAVEGTFAKF